jgi:hypothetical protein
MNGKPYPEVPSGKDLRDNRSALLHRATEQKDMQEVTRGGGR